MNIWEWVWDVEHDLREKGNERLAEIMDMISTWTCADEHDKVDQVYPEALALAKKESNRWIEVFIRHWYLQSQVLHRHNVKGMVREAVELLEITSQEDAKDCPQSVCAVQDLANTYAQKDGPSYVEERINVSEETLARINPTWPCFECIGDEYIAALVDAGRLDEALEDIERKRQQLLKASGYESETAFNLIETRILILQKKYEEAEKVIRNAENPGGGESFQRYKRAMTALALAYQGRFEEAKEFVLPFKEVLKAHSHFSDWAEYMHIVAFNDPQLNDDNLNYGFNVLVDKFIENGVQRDTLELLEWQAELAFVREDLFTIERVLEKAKLIIDELRKDFGASDWYKATKEKLEEARAEIDSSFSFEEDIELDSLSLTQLSILNSQNEENVNVLIWFLDKLDDNGFTDVAYSKASQAIENGLLIAPLISRYGGYLLSLNHIQEFDRFFSEERVSKFDESQKIYAYWIMSSRYMESDVDKAIELLKAIVDINPTLENILKKLATLLAESGDYKQAISYWTQLINLAEEENSHYHWDRLISATMLEDWESVRESSEVLDIELESKQGPVVENFGQIRIQVIDSEGGKVNLLATRTGPVSAKIYGMRELEEEQFFGDEIVFEPIPLNQMDSKDDDGNDCDSEGYYTYLYPIFKTKNKSDSFIFDFDGIYPGDELWSKVLEVFSSNDCVLSVRSTQEYQAFDIETDQYHDAVYCFAGTGAETNLDKLNKDLFKLIKDFEYPFVWGNLANKVGDVALLELQVKHEERFGLG